MLPTETLGLDVLGIELSYSLIIKLQPVSIVSMDVAKVVPIVSRPIMQHNTLKLVLKVLRVLLPFLLLNCIVIDVEGMGELPSRVHLLVFEFVVVEAYPLHVYNEIVW